jgi:hypothetical protein
MSFAFFISLKHIKIFSRIHKDKDKNTSDLRGERILSYLFYLFVNPTSGGNRAAELTKMEVDKDNEDHYKFFSFFLDRKDEILR